MYSVMTLEMQQQILCQVIKKQQWPYNIIILSFSETPAKSKSVAAILEHNSVLLVQFEVS